MNKVKLACLGTLLATGIASAAPICDGLQIRLKNNLADDLLVTGIKLNGAEIQPGVLEKLPTKAEQVFSINASSKDVPMAGEFVLQTVSLPSKTVKIQYILENRDTFCEHTDGSPQGDYTVEKLRKSGEVQYTILDK
ncbi:MAG: hypothetical protein H0T84_02190 [Tatlockia sp.]|nr:hypothetical protein [Tatlockia sp.]